MTIRIARVVAGCDFEKRVEVFRQAKLAHHNTIGEPAPLEHPIIEASLRRISRDGEPDDYVSDYEIIEPKPRILFPAVRATLSRLFGVAIIGCALFTSPAYSQGIICTITPSAGTVNQDCANTAYVAKSAGQLIIVPNVNFNATGDTPIEINLPAEHYSIRRLVVRGLTGTFGTAQAGLFTAVSGGGVALASHQVITISAVTDNALGNEFSLTIGSASLTKQTLFFNVGTPQGAVATGNVYLYLQPES